MFAAGYPGGAFLRKIIRPHHAKRTSKTVNDCLA
jgi:hypothetical protein